MTELIMSGVELMIVGMGIVYLFLTMLVFAINLMSFIVRRFFPEISRPANPLPPVAPGIDKKTVAAITASIHQYREKHK
jgi:oxaloacetate decarboxylase gamma subunit